MRFLVSLDSLLPGGWKRDNQGDIYIIKRDIILFISKRKGGM